jgi:hypothetical protein
MGALESPAERLAARFTAQPSDATMPSHVRLALKFEAERAKSAARKPRSTIERHQVKVLTDTLKMPVEMAGVMGGPDAEEAEQILRRKYQYTDSEISRLKGEAQQTLDRVTRQGLHELQEMLRRHGYDPNDAKKLQEEGMGATELEHILKTTRPGEMGSLEYTHNFKRIKTAARKPKSLAEKKDLQLLIDRLKRNPKDGDVERALRGDWDYKDADIAKLKATSRTAASLSDLKDALYNTPVRLKGYNGSVTISTAHGDADKARVLIQLQPEMTRSQHASLARGFATLADHLDAEWNREIDEAAMETWGRPWQVTDYRISGIGSDEFSNQRKTKLRTFAQGATKAKYIAQGHEAAAKSRLLAKTAGFSYGLDAMSVLFIEGRRPVPFNIDTIKAINNTAISIVGDDGTIHEVNLKFIDQQSSGPLTQPQEKLGWRREVRVDIQHPVDEGGSPQTSARATLAALSELGKRHGFKVEPVSRNYRPQTRKL